MENNQDKLVQIGTHNVDLELYNCEFITSDNSKLRKSTCKDYYEMYYVINGEGKFKVNEKEYILHENMGLIIEPFNVVIDKNHNNSSYKYIVIGLGGNKAKEYLVKANLCNNNFKFKYKNGDLLKNTLLNIIKDWSVPNSDIIRNSYLYEFIHLLIENNENVVTENIKDIREKYVEKALLFCNENLSKNITITDIADYININRIYLNKLFNEYINKSPKQYLMDIRINKACKLLVEENMDISSIALEVGYSNPYIFSRIFKKHMGLSPSNFRVKNKKVIDNNITSLKIKNKKNIGIVEECKRGKQLTKFREEFNEKKDLSKIEFLNLKRYNMDIDVYTCGYEKFEGYMFRGPVPRYHYLIHYVLKGQGVFKVNNKTYEIKENQGFLIEPYVDTFYESNRDDPWEYIWIGFVGNKCKDYLKRANISTDNPIFNYYDTKILEKCLFKIIKNLSKPNNNILLISNLYEFLYLLVENNINIVGEDKEGNIHKEYMRKALLYCEKYYLQDITVNNIADSVEIGRSYLNKLFNLYLNKSPKEFILELRLNKACQLLLETNLDVNMISSKVGYNNPFLFSKMFKKYKGVSPSEYRRNVPREFFLENI